VRVSARDIYYMSRALRLAARGRGRTGPNPMVGAVVVAGGQIVGEGFHEQVGGPHAEVIALRAAGPRARGATLYVTLEPCSHTRKRTPPCVPAIIAAGIRRVVAAMRDPNPQVNGEGLRQLAQAGLRVTVGCLAQEAERLNDGYLHRMRNGRPLVVLKMAMTLDGKTATATGEARWITGPEARRHAHRLRAQVDAVMVGVNTILADDPRLTARPGYPVARQPLRVVMDSRLRIPITARVLSPRLRRGTLIATTRHAPPTRVARFRQLGITVMIVPEEKGRVSLRACLRRLAKLGINRLLLEGGSELAASALRARVVDHLRLYVAPRLLGGHDAKGVFGGSSPVHLRGARSVAHLKVHKIGRDLLVDATL
jgi:diaminohydroxyphosphoribosylaminopyrimidine deaminase/5-amino-6-(5-phosphoribosylamino)uracil reductase